MTRSLRLIDLDGTELLTLTSPTAPEDDPLLVETLDIGYPDVREDVSDRIDQDGTDDSTTFVGAVGITAEFTAQRTAAGSAWEWVERLRSLSHPSRRMWLVAQPDWWPAERRILVRCAGFTAPFDDSPDGQVQWKAPRGVWETAAADQCTVSPEGGATVGLTAPFSAPISLTPADIPGAVRIVNAGSVETPPVIDIWGPCSAPKVTLDPDQSCSFPTLTIDAGVFLRVDMGARTALLNADPAQSQFTKRDFNTSTWWSLPRGESTLTFSATSPGDGCRAIVSKRDRHI